MLIISSEDSTIFKLCAYNFILMRETDLFLFLLKSLFNALSNCVFDITFFFGGGDEYVFICRKCFEFIHLTTSQCLYCR